MFTQIKSAILASMLLLSIPAGQALTLEGQVERIQSDLPQCEGRIGILVEHKKGNIKLIHKHSPARDAGLLKGDKVLLVDGLEHNTENISGEPGTEVSIVIDRKGSKIEFNIPRTERFNIKD